MVISISGMDNSGKTTQAKRLLEEYPELFVRKIHINDTNSFDKEKLNYEWWFNKSTPTEFTKTIYKCLEERIEYAKNIDDLEKVIIMEKGLDFYDARITATLLAKGLNIYDAILLQTKIRKEFNLEDIENIKFYLNPGNYKRKSDLFDIDQYKGYLLNNFNLLKMMNVKYEYINSGSIDEVTNEIICKIIKAREDLFEKAMVPKLSRRVC